MPIERKISHKSIINSKNQPKLIFKHGKFEKFIDNPHNFNDFKEDQSVFMNKIY